MKVYTVQLKKKIPGEKQNAFKLLMFNQFA